MLEEILGDEVEKQELGNKLETKPCASDKFRMRTLCYLSLHSVIGTAAGSEAMV